MKNKNLYETNWGYDERVHDTIVKLHEEYNNAIPVFGGALHAYKFVNSDDINIKAFAESLVGVPSSAIFYKWHEGIAGALRRYCRICLVDPALIEVYLGITFADIEKMYINQA